MVSKPKMVRIHVSLPRKLVDEIDALVGPRKRSKFIAEAIAQELQRRRELETTKPTARSLSDIDIPSLQTSESAGEMGTRATIGMERSRASRESTRAESLSGAPLESMMSTDTETAAKANQAHVVLPDDLLAEVDALVGPRKRSQFVIEAAEREVARRRRLEAAQVFGGSLADVDIPGWETSESAAEWVRAQRRMEREPWQEDEPSDHAR